MPRYEFKNARNVLSDLTEMMNTLDALARHPAIADEAAQDRIEVAKRDLVDAAVDVEVRHFE